MKTAARLSDPELMLLVGTTKGAFLLGRRAGSWEIAGPCFVGESVYMIRADGRGRLWAGVQNPFHGARLKISEDLGGSWTEPERPQIRFPEDTGASLQQIWQIAFGPEPDVIRVGVAPAALFISRDGGTTFELERALWDHPHRPRWNPGAGGLCLHTILPHPRHPERMVVAVSAAGVYRTDDGQSWSASNTGVRAQFLPDKHPEFGQCVHKIVRDPGEPDRLYLQNHWGVYRSDDDGRTWTDIASGLPSDFGFAAAALPDASVLIIPIASDMFRVTPDAKLRVYRTRDRGASWMPLTRGLPQEGAYETILRDALSTDARGGAAFGTRSGKLFYSPDGGEGWEMLQGGLPPITSVTSAVLS